MTQEKEEPKEILEMIRCWLCIYHLSIPLELTLCWNSVMLGLRVYKHHFSGSYLLKTLTYSFINSIVERSHRGLILTKKN